MAKAPVRPVMLWEGDDSEQPLMVPWKSCSESPCPLTLTAPRGVGRNGTRGIVIHGEGKGVMSVGWSFDRMGVFLPDDVMTMWIRVEGRSGSPAPECIWVALHQKMRVSRRVCLKDCDTNFADGRDHRVVVPISTLYFRGDGFDPQRVDGIGLNVEPGAANRNFDIYVDEIKLESLDAASLETHCWPQL